MQTCEDSESNHKHGSTNLTPLATLSCAVAWVDIEIVPFFGGALLPIVCFFLFIHLLFTAVDGVILVYYQNANAAATGNACVNVPL